MDSISGWLSLGDVNTLVRVSGYKAPSAVADSSSRLIAVRFTPFVVDMKVIAAAVLVLAACSTCAVPLRSCDGMASVYRCMFSGSLPQLPLFPFAPKKGAPTCGESGVATCCSKKMENSFNSVLRSMVDLVKGQAGLVTKTLRNMSTTIEKHLYMLQVTFSRSLISRARNNCRGGMALWSAVEKLMHSVLPVYEGQVSSMFDAVVTFFYRLSIQYIQSIIGSLSLEDAPTLDSPKDYNLKLCIANWGHHRHFTQNNSNLLAIACCMDTFILLSKRIADTLKNLSTIMAEVSTRSRVLHICPACKDAFVRNMFCHRCNNHPTLGACPSQCTKLIYECFPDISSISDAWNDVLLSVDELITALGSSRGICSCMNSIQTAVEAYCPLSSPPLIEDRKALARSLAADCAGHSHRPLTYGGDQQKNISDFLHDLGIRRSWYETKRNVQASNRSGALDDTEGLLHNVPHQDSSCLGAETIMTGNGQQLALQISDLQDLSNVMMPQGRLFGDFCRWSSSAGCPKGQPVQLVSRGGHCWNGTEKVLVRVDRANQKANSQRVPSTIKRPSKSRCQREGRQHRCCNQSSHIVTQLEHLAKQNRLYLCHLNSSSSSNELCKRCGSDFSSGDQ